MSYLTESKLNEILDTSEYTFIHNKQLCKGIQYRPDFKCDDLMLIIEFDGYHHYDNTKTQIRDKEKHSLYKDMGYTLIRIPYFIQLTEKVYEQLFINEGYDLGIDRSTLVTYPHGFHDPKALMPSDFNIVGLDLFMKQMAREFRPQQYEVFDSLVEDFEYLHAMKPMKNLVTHISGYVESGYDCNGMLKNISEFEFNRLKK